MEKWKQSSFNFITITGITFRVEVKDKVPGRKKKTKKTKETMRGTKKKVCGLRNQNKIRPRQLRTLWTVEACKVRGKNFYGVEKRLQMPIV